MTPELRSRAFSLFGRGVTGRRVFRRSIAQDENADSAALIQPSHGTDFSGFNFDKDLARAGTGTKNSLEPHTCLVARSQARAAPSLMHESVPHVLMNEVGGHLNAPRIGSRSLLLVGYSQWLVFGIDDENSHRLAGALSRG